MSISTKTVKLADKISITKIGAAYKPKASSAQGNAATWSSIQSALAKPQTVGSLVNIVREKHNHAPFVGYCIRRGWLKTS